MTSYVEIAAGAGEPTELPLSAPVVVGSSSSADVSLPSSGLAPRHLTLSPADGGCLVAPTPEATAPVLVEGLPHEGGVVPWGVTLTVADVSIRLVGERTPTARPSPIVLMSPFILGVAIWALTTSPETTEIPTAPEAPAIFGELPTRCRSEGANTFHLGSREAAAARSRQQRYPFDAREGVPSVTLYLHAARCLEVSGHADEAQELDARANALRERVEGDYDTARFRLSRALSNGDHELAISEAQLLLSLLDGREGPYVDWLILLDRRLRLAVARESS